MMRGRGSESCLALTATLPQGRVTRLLAALLILGKPGIVLAESLAALLGMLLAVRPLPLAAAPVFWSLLALVLAASGAAMANSVLDAEADQRMPRLAARCRALATVGAGRTLILAGLLMSGAFLLAGFLLNRLTLGLLVAACGSYLLLYTRWLKRSSPWGVLAGALPGALPPLIGAAAVSGRVSALPLLFGAIILVWQIPHFLFLALRYRDEYGRAGLPVLPVRHGVALSKGLTLASALALLPLTLVFSWIGAFSAGLTLVIFLAGMLFVLFCYAYLWRVVDYRKGFVASLVYLAILFAALLTAAFLTVQA